MYYNILYCNTILYEIYTHIHTHTHYLLSYPIILIILLYLIYIIIYIFIYRCIYEILAIIYTYELRMLNFIVNTKILRSKDITLPMHAT